MLYWDFRLKYTLPPTQGLEIGICIPSIVNTSNYTGNMIILIPKIHAESYFVWRRESDISFSHMLANSFCNLSDNITNYRSTVTELICNCFIIETKCSVIQENSKPAVRRDRRAESSVL